jgi:hypothetical protein
VLEVVEVVLEHIIIRVAEEMVLQQVPLVVKVLLLWSGKK